MLSRWILLKYKIYEFVIANLFFFLVIRKYVNEDFFFSKGVCDLGKRKL